MKALVKTNTRGKEVTTSLIIAEVFEKDQKNVLRDIQELSCSQEFRELNFELLFITRELPNGGSKQSPIYELNKDGFSFLVMGYTGEKAGQFKEKFINEFNKLGFLLSSDDYIIDRALHLSIDRIKSLESQISIKEQQIELQEHTIQVQAPKVLYYDAVLQSKTLIVTNVIAKQLGLSAITLNAFLARMDVIYRSGQTWVLHHKYQNKGYAGFKTYKFTDPQGNEQTTIHTYWTEKGRQFIHNLWTSENQRKK